MKKRPRQAVAYRQLRRIQDIDAFVENARNAPFSANTIRAKISKHGDFGSEAEARAFVASARENPDAVYYQFHQGRSTIVFEKDGVFVFATDRKGKSFFAPARDGLRPYREHVVERWIQLT